MAKNNDVGQRTDDEVIYVSIGVVSVVIIAALIIYGIGFAQQKQADGYENKIAGINKEISQLEEVKEKALALGIQEEEIGSLYKKQANWSKAIDGLAESTLKKVTLSSVSVDKTAEVSLSGTTDSYLNINKQVVALNNSENFSDVKLTDVSRQNNENTSKIDFTVSAKLLGF